MTEDVSAQVVHLCHDTANLDGASIFVFLPFGPEKGIAETGIESRVLVERLLLIPHEAGLRGLRPPQPPPAGEVWRLRWLARNPLS